MVSSNPIQSLNFYFLLFHIGNSRVLQKNIYSPHYYTHTHALTHILTNTRSLYMKLNSLCCYPPLPLHKQICFSAHLDMDRLVGQSLSKNPNLMPLELTLFMDVPSMNSLSPGSESDILHQISITSHSNHVQV